MRWHVITLVFLTACSGEANHLGNPVMLPVSGIGTAFDNAAYNRRRGAVEVIVKTEFDTIVADIRAGGGAVLSQAFDRARVPLQDRPARIIQLQSDIILYINAPDALVTALMVYGG